MRWIFYIQCTCFVFMPIVSYCREFGFPNMAIFFLYNLPCKVTDAEVRCAGVC